ncbi:MAG: NFACT family protein [Chloroflexi bacterium]|nr:NFACT family protein [Chloroflexota bacterium]
MSFDVFTISALVDEFMDTLVGGRVQDVIDVDEMGLGLEIYANRRRHYLYMSAEANQPRLYLAAGKLRRGLMKPTQLGLLCRRTVESGIVAHVSQPAWERLLQIDIAGPEGDVSLIVELMPRRANVLLLRDGVILDCLKRVGPDENRYRLSLPNHDYVPPPPIRGQLAPDDVSLESLRRIMDAVEKPSVQTRRVLPGRILGMSPLLAKEIVFRASGRPDAKAQDSDCRALLDAYRALVAPLLRRRWQPGIGYEMDVAAEFAAFPLSFLDWQARPTMSGAISEFYGLQRSPDAYDEAKKPVRKAIDEARARLSAKLSSLKQGLKDESELRTIKQSGELILAYQTALRDGQELLRAHYEPDEPELIIKLDPELSPIENAQSYFRRYEKAKGARKAIPSLIAETTTELAFMAQLESDLSSANNWPEIDDVIQILQERGHWQGKKLRRIGGGGRQGPLRVVSRDGYVVWIGRNSRQNESLTFKTANSQDLWLHARGVPGAHVVIRNDGRRIGDDLILEAAAVAAHYSQKRNDQHVSVDYTRVKFVKAIKGAGPGMVTYRNEKTVSVAPRDETALRK